MKHQWRKDEKALYIGAKQPVLLEIPEQKFISITGQGNPNGEDYAARIAALYPMAYNLRFKLKRGEIGNEPFEYTVYPLEGVWTSVEYTPGQPIDKNLLVYKIMIRQPDVISQVDFEDALAESMAKKPNDLYAEVQFETYTEGQVVQMLHVGPFDMEAETFAVIEAFMSEQGLERDWIMQDYVHREIYLTDPRKIAPEKYKTTLRVKVKAKNP